MAGGSAVKAARVSSAEVEHAKAVAEKAGLRLAAYQKSPDGTVKLEFGEFEPANDWRAGSPLYDQAS
jgi:hypothetical protein